jgi:hypothetical protein
LLGRLHLQEMNATEAASKLRQREQTVLTSTLEEVGPLIVEMHLLRSQIGELSKDRDSAVVAAKQMRLTVESIGASCASYQNQLVGKDDELRRSLAECVALSLRLEDKVIENGAELADRRNEEEMRGQALAAKDNEIEQCRADCKRLAKELEVASQRTKRAETIRFEREEQSRKLITLFNSLERERNSLRIECEEMAEDKLALQIQLKSAMGQDSLSSDSCDEKEDDDNDDDDDILISL